MPTESEIKSTALLLEKVLACEVVDKSIQTPTITGDSQERDVPSVQACYESFEKLSKDHPIKKEADSTNVMLGFYGLEGLGFNPSRNYLELAATIAIARG
ncbi:hypothetical protein GOV13_02245 [Candidatus Pacearchaeota archaeon]|nr:hypothetical protein [Candidatus Pacearchaeota archaeon]